MRNSVSVTALTKRPSIYQLNPLWLRKNRDGVQVLGKLELEGKGMLRAFRWTTGTHPTFFLIQVCRSVPGAEVRVVRNGQGTPLEKPPPEWKVLGEGEVGATSEAAPFITVDNLVSFSEKTWKPSARNSLDFLYLTQHLGSKKGQVEFLHPTRCHGSRSLQLRPPHVC